MNIVLDQSSITLQHPTVHQTESLTVEYDSSTRALWLFMHATPRPCVTETLLREIQGVHRRLSAGEFDVDFYVLASRAPEVFSLGGDLNLFRNCALNRDWERLENYAKLCIDMLHDIVSGFGRQTISISLIQGDALGGGFESALATDFMYAEEQARLGFPEVLFNLFPGMGAYSFLARKLSPQAAQRLILSAKTYTARDLHAQGLLDEIVGPNEGIQAVHNFMRETRKHVRGYKHFLNARRRASFWPRKDELLEIVFDWLDAVKETSSRDLRLMDKLVMAQNRLKVCAA